MITFNRLSCIMFFWLLLFFGCRNINFALIIDTTCNEELVMKNRKTNVLFIKQVKNNKNNKIEYHKISKDLNEDKKKYIRFAVDYSQLKLSVYGYWYYMNLYYPNRIKLLYYGIKILNFLGFLHIDNSVFPDVLLHWRYFTFFLTRQYTCYRGIGSIRCFYNENFKYKFLGCEWYFGIGNIPYIGIILSLAFVCKPNFILKYLPKYMHDRITIHIVDLKPLNFLLALFVRDLCLLYPKEKGEGRKRFIYYKITTPKNTNLVITSCDYVYMRITNCKVVRIGVFTVEIQIMRYYNISINIGSILIPLL